MPGSCRGQISSEPKATIVLRGGHVIRSVPISKLADPDGVNWTYTEDEGFKDRRGYYRRIMHVIQGWKSFAPRCQSVMLVVNAHQQIPLSVFHRWRRTFRDAGFDVLPFSLSFELK
mmetsp:Transcript_49788/g.155807  ORF Transcript_49788/g.155807 Transcript_49788/m.155807 type:complete len:116 (+) Transcript_49788:844-1191(+)